MFETIVVATDGSESVDRAVGVALDIAERFDAAVHALYVVDTTEIDASPEDLREEMDDALRERGQAALESVTDRTDRATTTAVREGRPASEITGYVREVDADLVVTGTRGRHGENRLLIGSVAENVVRTCSAPVLTVRQLDADADPNATRA